jgi:hypothetical protein
MDSKIIATLVGIAVSVLAICNMNLSSKENFGFGHQGAVKVFQSARTPSGQSAGLRGMVSDRGHNQFVSYPSMQYLLSPRMSGGIGIPATIRYNMPDRKNMGVNSCNPLNPSAGPPTLMSAAAAVKENFAQCGAGGTALPSNCMPNPISSSPSNFQTGNRKEVLNSMLSGQRVTDSMPNNVCGIQTTNSVGESTNPVIYNNYVYANRKSRLNGLGDRIRGDLPIKPSTLQWFRPAVNPNIDLTQGAMNVMGGVGNGTARELSEFIFDQSGGSEAALGGVPVSQFNMGNQFQGQISGGHSDVTFSAFP